MFDRHRGGSCCSLVLGQAATSSTAGMGERAESCHVAIFCTGVAAPPLTRRHCRSHVQSTRGSSRDCASAPAPGPARRLPPARDAASRRPPAPRSWQRQQDPPCACQTWTPPPPIGSVSNILVIERGQAPERGPRAPPFVPAVETRDSGDAYILK
jgi:hypothetical protein